MTSSSSGTAIAVATDRREVTFTFDVWREESRELAEKPWYMNYRFRAAGILMVTAAMVVYFI